MAAIYNREFSITEFVFYQNDFINGSTSLDGGLAASNSGGTSSAVATTSADRSGVIQLSTGTTAATDQRGAVGTNLSTTIMGGGYANMITCGFQPKVLHDGATLTGWFRFGWANVISSASNESIEISTTDGGNYLCRTVAGGVATVTDTGIAPVVDTWQDFAIMVNPAGTAVYFYRVVSGVTTLIATHTTNISTTAIGVRCTCHRAQATATAIVYNVDYLNYGRTFASARWPRF